MVVSKNEVIFIFDTFRVALENKIIHEYYYLTHGWTLEFNNSKSCAGLCIEKGQRIVLSMQFINSLKTTIQDVMETILHELAHAIAGVYNMHNNTWKTIAMKIGSTGEEFCDIFATYKFKLECPMGCCHYRHQLVKKVYTERKKGYATCPKHKTIPVLVTRISDNKIINTYSTLDDFKTVCRHFMVEEHILDKICPTLK